VHVEGGGYPSLVFLMSPGTFTVTLVCPCCHQHYCILGIVLFLIVQRMSAMNATSFSEQPSRPTLLSTAEIVLRTLVQSYGLLCVLEVGLCGIQMMLNFSLTFNGAGVIITQC